MRDRFPLPAPLEVDNTSENISDKGAEMLKCWYVYLVRCRDNTYYTGITNNVAKRIDKHNAGKGAVYTAGRRPVKLVYQEKHSDKSSACKREIQIKDWRREKKEWIASRLRSK